MLSLYYSFLLGYINYGNITWCSTSITKLKELACKQKQAPRTIPIPNLYFKQIMEKLCILNIYQVNISNMAQYPLFKILPFFKFHSISHDYFTKNSMCNFKEPRFSLKITKFTTSSRLACLWNKVLDNIYKAFTSSSLFQKTIKNRLINLENIASFF